MPHAALWVVQRPDGGNSIIMTVVSMPHAALWVVQHQSRHIHGRRPRRFNAARGFVGGAATMLLKTVFMLSMFQCRTRLCGWCSIAGFVVVATACCFNAARGFVGGAALIALYDRWDDYRGFNAARGFVGGAAAGSAAARFSRIVSMPHAALWVVQLRRSQPLSP